MYVIPYYSAIKNANYLPICIINKYIIVQMIYREKPTVLVEHCYTQ